MSIKLKLQLSFIAMALIPVFFLLSVGVIILFSIGYDDVRDFFKNEKEIEFQQTLILGEISYVLREDRGQPPNADYLHGNADYLKGIEERIEKASMGFVITKDGELQYVSPNLRKNAPNRSWLKLLQASPDNVTLAHYGFQMNQFSFHYPDGSEGEAAVLRKTDIVPVYWRPIIFVIALVTILLVSAVLTFLVSRTITRPLYALKRAAMEIKDGNLDIGVKPTTRDEIGELGTAFEEMRIRLKSSIEQSHQYEDDRKMLISHISHDLKTPITAIKGYVEGIMDGVANTPEKQEKYMRTVYRKAVEMDKLIDELFLFSKLDLHKETFNFRDIDLRAYMVDYMEEVRYELEKQQIETRLELGGEEERLLVVADPEKLVRVLTNMVGNCLKYMNQPGHKLIIVRVLEEQAEDRVRIEIEDNGPGIPEEALPYLFERFYRAEESRGSQTGGSGLGLAIVKQIVEEHGGSVHAANGAVGAKFAFTLRKV